MFVVGAARSLMDIGVFEAIPAHGSASATNLAAACDAEKQLIG